MKRRLFINNVFAMKDNGFIRVLLKIFSFKRVKFRRNNIQLIPFF